MRQLAMQLFGLLSCPLLGGVVVNELMADNGGSSGAAGGFATVISRDEN